MRWIAAFLLFACASPAIALLNQRDQALVQDLTVIPKAEITIAHYAFTVFPLPEDRCTAAALFPLDTRKQAWITVVHRLPFSLRNQVPHPASEVFLDIASNTTDQIVFEKTAANIAKGWGASPPEAVMIQPFPGFVAMIPITGKKKVSFKEIGAIAEQHYGNVEDMMFNVICLDVPLKVLQEYPLTFDKIQTFPHEIRFFTP